MELNSIMASQLRSLQSTVQLSVMHKAMAMNTTAATDMLQSLPDQPSTASHPHKGLVVDQKA
ncbi:putative motility protein [Sporosarcina saromensis]|uniref:Motility protein n=1 Tax=Sporosarcina saromensis TaxID=359365 RepID=A0ABU4GDD5_9BACL|nr:putative motility protein [Sporosarcina saromensis]MDW0114989.1 putative motility protein [Sporosarcina saromensis]